MSVRKRVIKILKDICVLQPDFPQISDICVRMIRRISDEEGIKVGMRILFLYKILFDDVNVSSPVVIRT